MSQQLISYEDIKARGIKASMVTLWRWERANRFPRRVTISHQKVAWLESEINQWLAARIESRAVAA